MNESNSGRIILRLRDNSREWGWGRSCEVWIDSRFAAELSQGLTQIVSLELGTQNFVVPLERGSHSVAVGGGWKGWPAHSRPLDLVIEPGSTTNLVVAATRRRRHLLRWGLPLFFCMVLGTLAAEWLLNAIGVEDFRLAEVVLKWALALSGFFGFLFATRRLFPNYWALWTIEIDNAADGPAASSETSGLRGATAEPIARAQGLCPTETRLAADCADWKQER